MSERTNNCHHCGLPIPPGVDIGDTDDGQSVYFCCHGCHGAFLIITGSGLDKFYRQRDWTDSGVPEGAFETEYDESTLAPYVVRIDDDVSEISFLVDGIRCASCVWLLEKVLTRQSGVVDSRINYGSHRATVRFRPDTISPEELLRIIGRLGYLPRPFSHDALQQAAIREQRSLLIRFGTAAFLSMQLMGYSLALYAGYFHGIEPHVRQIIQFFAAAVTTPVVFYSGWPFLSGALRSLRNRTPNMDLLVALGVLTAYSYSIYAMFQNGEVYFDSAGMIVTLILLGRLLESSARNRSVAGIDRLLQLAPDTARQTDGSRQWTVQSINLKPGDSIVVLPGERIPVDARIIEGESEFDESAVTGESLPVCRGIGERVTSGSLNLTGSTTLEVEKIKAESFISRMNRLVEEAQGRKAPVQLLADRIAAFFVPLVIVIALATCLFWALVGAENAAILNAVAVLVVACPCALGLATPTAVLVASGKAAAVGILFRGGDMMEATSRIDTVAFDKTGTLTRGKPTVTDILPVPGISVRQLLEEAAVIAAGSNHPLARAILDKAQVAGVPHPPAVTAETVPGHGLVVKKDDQPWRLGSRTFLSENGISISTSDDDTYTEVHLAADQEYRGRIIFSDDLRPDAEAAVSQLHHHHIRTALLSGDRDTPVRTVAATLGIDEIEAAIDPAGKAEWIKTQQEQGCIVAMVGDGINDAPALSQADVGCAMAGGTDIALETSDLVMTRPDFRHLIAAFRIARKCMTAIRQNLFWAFSYNLVAIPLAASGHLAPVWAAAAMASSSLIVIGNSLRLGSSLQKGLAIDRSQD